MILTEQEAKTKQCPETLTIQLGDASSIAASCLGSACMAWRWVPDCSGADSDGALRAVGYCGKAGEP